MGARGTESRAANSKFSGERTEERSGRREIGEEERRGEERRGEERRREERRETGRSGTLIRRGCRTPVWPGSFLLEPIPRAPTATTTFDPVLSLSLSLFPLGRRDSLSNGGCQSRDDRGQRDETRSVVSRYSVSCGGAWLPRACPFAATASSGTPAYRATATSLTHEPTFFFHDRNARDAQEKDAVRSSAAINGPAYPLELLGRSWRFARPSDTVADLPDFGNRRCLSPAAGNHEPQADLVRRGLFTPRRG